jgi:hypothetical protein
MSIASPLRESEWRRRSPFGSGLRGDGAHPLGEEVRSIAAAMGRPTSGDNQVAVQPPLTWST